MLSNLQKQMDEQRAEAARDREKAILQREAVTHLHNQLVADMEILRKSQSTNQRIEGSRTHSSPSNATRVTRTKSNRRRDRSLSLVTVSTPRTLGRTGSQKLLTWRISTRSSESRLRRQVNFFGRDGALRLNTFESPLFEEITSHRFSKKVVMPSFECYSGATVPIRHLRQYEDKMAVYSQMTYS